MSHVRIGLIGCGRIAQAVHLPVLKALPGVQLTAIAESDPDTRAAASALAPSAAVFEDYQALVDSRTIDAVVICLPPHLHAPSAIAAFQAGLHVYVEKPLAPTLAVAEPMVAAWKRAGTIGMVGFNFRFHPQVVAARAELERQAIGTVLAVRTSFSLLPHTLPSWKRDLSMGGGVLLDLASHHIDLVQFLLDDRVTRVFASYRENALPLDAASHAAVQLTLASGVIAQLFVSLGSVEENRLEFFGSTGKVTIDRTELITPQRIGATLTGARVTRARLAVQALHPRRLLKSPGHEPSFALALAAFARAVVGGSFHGPDLADGADCLSVVDAAERSTTSGIAESPARRPGQQAAPHPVPLSPPPARA